MADQTDNKITKGDQYDGFVHTFTAEGAILKDQLLELGTAFNQVKLHTTTTTTPVVGIALADADTTEEVPVMCFGPIKNVIAAAAGIVRGQMVYASGTTAGSCTSQAYADGTTLHGAIGIALVTADAIGEIVPVLCGWPGVVANN